MPSRIPLLRPSDITALILAGGQSRRFGSDKALADVGGLSFVERVFGALEPLASRVLIATGPEPRPYPVRAEIVTDLIPDGGPLAGLGAGLDAARTPWLLAVAVDMPHLTPEALAPLLEAASGDTDAVIAQEPGEKMQPVCGLWRVEAVAPVVREQLARGDLAMFALLDRLRVQGVALDASAIRNVNLPLRRDLRP